MATLKGLTLSFAVILISSSYQLFKDGNKAHAQTQSVNSAQQQTLTFRGKKKNVNTDLKKNVSRVNHGTVGIITGDIGGTYIRIASDLAAVLDSNRMPKLRLLPIAGKGGVSNIEDLLFLRDIDLAIVQSDVLSFLEKKKKFRDVRSKINYVMKLFDSEVHIIARKEIRDIRQLQNKKVNLRYPGSSSDLTGQAILRAFNISVIPTYFDQSLALEKVKKGELDASIAIAGKPSDIYRQIGKDSNLRLIPIQYNNALSRNYLPAKFTHEEYPNLVEKGKTIPTIASSTVLAVYNWQERTPRYEQVELLVYNLFTYITDLKKPERHKKWSSTSPVTKVPGWKRFKPAQQWIDNSYRFVNSKNASTAIFKLSSNTLNDGMTPQERLRLFKHFKSFLSRSRASGGLNVKDPKEMYRLFENFLKWRNSATR